MKKHLLAGLVLLAGTLPLSANPIQANFTGVNGTTDFGYYVGPYYGKLDGDAVTLYCVDFANDVYFGQTWAANLSSIVTGSDLENTRYGGGTDALQLYQEAAWLTLQYALNPTSDYGDIQAAIWQLFDRNAPEPSSDYWLSQAQANYAAGNYADFMLVTNVGPVNPTGQVQEFLTVVDPSMPLYNEIPAVPAASTPEPKLMWVLGMALLAIAAAVRHRRRRGT